jgi:hypothetical protein
MEIITALNYEGSRTFIFLIRKKILEHKMRLKLYLKVFEICTEI